MTYLDRAITPIDRENTDHIDNLSQVDWVAANYKPDEVFTYTELSMWALANGFVLPETKTNTY